MANNLVVQLLLKTGTFSSDLKTARGEIQSFQQGCSNAGRTLTQMGNSIGINIGSLTKLGTAAGIAVAAVKGFKSVMESTQTTSDRLDDSIAGLKGVVEAFKISLATADFSKFKNGLWDIFDAAVNTRRAMDDLADAKLGYAMLSSDNQANFAEYQNNYREARENWKNAKTDEERAKFQADMEKWEKKMRDVTEKEEEVARNFQYKNMNAIKADVHEFNPAINVEDVTEAAIMRAAEIFNSVDSEKQKEAVRKRAKDIMKTSKEFETDSKAYQYLKDYDRQFDLVVAALVEMGDEKIQRVAEELQAGKSARRSSEAMRRSLNRTVKPESTTEVTRTTRTGGSTKQDYGEVGSLTYLEHQLAEKTAEMNKTVQGSDKYNLLKAQVALLTESIKKLKDAEKDYVEGSIKDLQDKLAVEQELMNKVDPKSDEFAVHKQNVMDLQEQIKELQSTEKKYNEWSIQGIKDRIAAAQHIVDTTTVFDEGHEKAVEDVRVLSRYLAEMERIMNGMEAYSDLDYLMEIEPKTISSLQKTVSCLQTIRDTLKDLNDEGSIQEIKEINDTIELLNTAINKTQTTGTIKAPDTSGWETFGSALSGVASIASSLSTVLRNVVDDETAKRWEKFFNGVSATVSVMQAMASIISTVTTLQETFGKVFTKTSTENAVASTAEAEAVVASKGAEAGAAAAAAGAEGASAVASIPIVGPALAIAAAAAIVAAIIAAMSKAKSAGRFANGGIVGGSSFTGDRMTAQVNSGEMILNKSQQARLFELANGGGNTGGNQVTFHISGTDLVGVLNNNNRKNNLIR